MVVVVVLEGTGRRGRATDARDRGGAAGGGGGIPDATAGRKRRRKRKDGWSGTVDARSAAPSSTSVTSCWNPWCWLTTSASRLIKRCGIGSLSNLTGFIFAFSTFIIYAQLRSSLFGHSRI